MLDERAILTLLLTPQVGRRTIHKVVLSAPSSPEPRALHGLLCDVKRTQRALRVPTVAAIEHAQAQAEAVLAQVHRSDVQVLGIGHAAFPPQLRTIDDPPVLLYTRGNVQCLVDNLCVAVVGTRHPTPYGRRLARRCGLLFSERGFAVVSGLAAGCDMEAHRGCLDVHGRTVAVLAHGLDTVYPAVNRVLAHDIVTAGGCLVSEYAPSVLPHKGFFVERDRLQSGLSAGVVVIETGVDGGAMHTARFCQQQGRVLACVQHPSHVTAPQVQGNRQLLTDVANVVPLASSADIERFIERLRAVQILP